MATDKYDLHTIDYSVQGWDAIMTTDMENLDDNVHTRLLMTLGETVAAKKAVYLPVGGTKVFKAQADQTKRPALGLTIESGVNNDEIRVQRVGPITDAGWSFTTGTPVYLDPDTAGELTQTPPANKQFMGIPKSATTLILAGTIDSDSLPGTSSSSSSASTSVSTSSSNSTSSSESTSTSVSSSSSSST